MLNWVITISLATDVCETKDHIMAEVENMLSYLKGVADTQIDITFEGGGM